MLSLPWGRRPLALVAGVLLCVADVAHADDSHYQDFVVGGRALGLGGAFTSLSDAPAGLYYNPAGIADVRDSSYSVSASLYGFERRSYGAEGPVLVVAGLEDLQIEFTDLVIIPASAGFVQTFGEPGVDGRPRHAFGFSAVVPSFRTFTASDPLGQQSTEHPSLLFGEQRISYSRRVTDRALWTGAGYAYKVTPWLRLGVSGYYILRSTTDVEELTTSATIDDGDGDSSNDSQVFRSATNSIDFLNGNLVFIAGAKVVFDYRDSWVNLGLSFVTPSIPIHSQATLRFQSDEAAPSCDSLSLTPTLYEQCINEEILTHPHSRFETVEVEGSSETQYPATLRAGISYVRKKQVTISADVSFHFPTRYQLIESPELTSDLLARIPFNPEVERRAVVNFNLGIEYLVIGDVSVAAGLFSDFSSAPDVPRGPTTDAQPKVDIMGLTAALGYFSEHSLSRIGVLYSWGAGYDVIPASDVERLLSSEQAFKRIETFHSFFYVFVSSTFRY